MKKKTKEIGEKMNTYEFNCKMFKSFLSVNPFEAAIYSDFGQLHSFGLFNGV